MLRVIFETGAPEPPPRRVVNEWRDDNGALVGTGYCEDGRYWIVWQGLGVLAFANGSRDVHVWPHAALSRSAVADSFERVLQPAVLQALGWEALHAGASVGPAGLVGFCGPSRAGKS